MNTQPGRSKPNEAGLSDTQRMNRDWWAECLRIIGPVARDLKPSVRPYINFSVGRTDFYLTGAFSRQKKQVRAGLYIGLGDDAKAFFDLLARDRVTISGELFRCSPLEWKPFQMGPPISTRLENANPKEKSDWRRQHEWLADCLNEMHKVGTRLLDA